MGLRETVFEIIGEFISYGKAPLTVVVGPPGSGKTTFLKRLVEYISVPWFLFYNEVRATEYAGLIRGSARISGDCVYNNAYELVKYIKTSQSDFVAIAEAIVCELLRMKGLSIANQCGRVTANLDVLELARLELKPALKWIDFRCVINSGAIPYQSHVDLLRIPLLRCCVGSYNFVVIIDDIELIPRIDFLNLIKTMGDRASVVVAMHLDPTVDKEISVMASSAHILCLTPRNEWVLPQINYWRYFTHKYLGYKIEPTWGAYMCRILHKEMAIELPPPKEKSTIQLTPKKETTQQKPKKGWLDWLRPKKKQRKK